MSRLVRASFAALGGCVLLGCGSAPPAASEPKSAPATSVAEPRVDPRYAELPAPTKSAPFVPPTATHLVLESGVELYFVPAPHVPLVSIQVIVPMGAATDPRGKEGLTSLTVDLLDDGAGKLSEFELSDELGRLATDFHSQVTHDSVVLSMNSLAENVEPSLALLAEIWRAPRLEAAAFERARERRLSEAAQRRKNPSAALGLGIGRALFGSGYGAGPIEGTEESLSAITRKDVQSQAKELAKLDGVKVLLVGQLPFESAKELSGRAFRGKPEKRNVRVRAVEPPPPGKVALLFPFPGAAQSSIAVVRRAGSFRDPKYFEELVYNRQIGEAFTSRINMNLREEKGYTYGATSLLRRHAEAGFFAVVTNVQSAVTGASLEEIFRELTDVCGTRPLLASERDAAVQGLLEGFPGKFERTEEIASQFASLPLYGRPLDYFVTWRESVAAVGLESAQAAAKPFCDLTSYRVVVAGDETAARPTLEKLGFTVELVDAPPSPPKR